METALMENLEVIKYDITDAAIQTMKQEYSGLTITDRQSYDLVVKAIANVRTKRTDVEKRRKDLKASALEWGRKVDAEAKRITALLTEIEDPLKTMKQEEDEKRMAAQREAERKEAERVAGIKALINQIREMVPTVPSNSACLGSLIRKLNSMEIIPDVFMEFFQEAYQAKQETMDKLTEMHYARIKWDEEERQRKEELARLEALRAENARLEHERQIREAEERAAREAEERARQAEKEKLEAERRALEAEKARIEAEKRAEEERKEREEEERQRQIKELESIRARLLAEIGYIYPLDDLGTLPDDLWSKLYFEHKVKWDKEQERIRLERGEQARKEREEFERQAKVKAEQEARERLEREEFERQAQLKAEEEERKRQEALKPDREKLLSLAGKVANIAVIDLPTVNHERAKEILENAKIRIEQTALFIRQEVEAL